MAGLPRPRRGRRRPPYAAPARALDLTGLPPTAELDLFLDEDVDYAQRLVAAGVPTELHVYRGAVHGFDLFAPDAEVSRRYLADRTAALRRALAPAAAGISGAPAS